MIAMHRSGWLLLTFAVLTPLAKAETRVTLVDGRWHINGAITHAGSRAEGLLQNVRMVNATFEDKGRPEFDAEANTERFIARIPDYAAQGVDAFTLCLQGGMPGYEGAVNSAFEPDGSLRAAYMARVRRVIEVCDRQGLAVILGCYYQRQSGILEGEAALRAGVVNVAKWIRDGGFRNVLLEIANEYPHRGFKHPLIRSPEGMAGLLKLAKETHPNLLVTASGYGGGDVDAAVAEACDFLTPHFNGTPVAKIPERLAALKKYGKPIVCNEDAKSGEEAARAAEACAAAGASYGLMLEKVNQHFPFAFTGAADDPVFYARLKALTTPPKRENTSDRAYFPPPESAGGWRRLTAAEDIRTIGGMDPAKLDALREWLLQSDERPFAAVVIRHGHIVLEVERGKSAVTDTGNVKSCAKAICATVLAIAAEESKQGKTPKRMTFDDRAFDFLPWAQPLSDPRKAEITVRQLLNHTSGICPESTGAKNGGPWERILGHTDDERTARLAFAPGQGHDYTTFAFYHAALVCEHVTGQPYDRYAIDKLFRPLGIERWWFEVLEGDDKHGDHPSHTLGLPARDLARVPYCLLNGGTWDGKQVVPKWFALETATPSHARTGPTPHRQIPAESFSTGWELPARRGEAGRGLPADARFKPGSGGQLIAFVPSLDLVISRQTGGSGSWHYEEYLRRACAAVVTK